MQLFSGLDAIFSLPSLFLSDKYDNYMRATVAQLWEVNPTWLRVQVLFLLFHKLGGCRLWKTAERGRLARWVLGLALPHAPDTLPPTRNTKARMRDNQATGTRTSPHRKLNVTSFPELGIAVVTHFGHSVFEVLQRVSVPGTSTANHLTRPTANLRRRYTDSLQHLDISPYATLPQALQWCRRSVRLKSEVQFIHIITWEIGTSTGAASPRAIHSFSRAWVDKIEIRLLR